MNASLDDLRHALQEGAATDPGPAAAAARLAGVRRLVVQRRRRQIAATAATALAVVAVGVTVVDGAGSLHLLRDPGPAASVTPRPSPTAAGMPEYSQGGRLIGSAGLPAVVGMSTSFTVVPTTWGLAVSETCTDPSTTQVRLEINGNVTMEGGCDSSTTRAGWGRDQEFWSGSGVRLGQATLTVTLTVTSVATGSAASSPGVVAAGVYQEVPRADYPFPPAPASATATPQLPVHDLTAPGAAAARPVTLYGPNGTWKGSIAYSPRLVVQVDAWGPGQVTVALGGRPVTGASFWDYGVNGTAVDLRPETLRGAGVAVPAAGSNVEVTVTFSDFAHHTWQALIGPEPTS